MWCKLPVWWIIITGWQKGLNMNKIPFNKPAISGKELVYLTEVLQNGYPAGDGIFAKRCWEWLEKTLGCKKALLTPSCTHALEMAAILADIQPGDEVIMPSYTFVSTANAFVLRGAKIVFVDIRPDTMNIDENLIEQAITTKTKIIVPVHYAGVGCEMDMIMDIARRYNLLVIEDAAQGILASYKGKYLGTIGHLGCLSFHETKNISCGEGGALLINDPALIERAEIVREKGTNRSRFFRGQVDKYTWVDIGSSYLMSEFNAAVLLAQFEKSAEITNHRRQIWDYYYKNFQPLAAAGHVYIPSIPSHCIHNGHLFYIKVRDLNERTNLISFLAANHISAVFHYIPLHSSQAGQIYGIFCGKDQFTTLESDRLLRLPLFWSITENELGRVTRSVNDFFNYQTQQ